MMVAAASAWEAVRASTVTASAMPSEKLRPWRPLVAMPARGIIGVDHHRAQKALAIGPIHQADGELFALTQMQRDIAAIIDVSALKLRRRQHGAKDFFRDRARHRRHRRDETVGGKRRHRRMHPARDDALQRALQRIGRRAQFAQLLAELVKQTGEAARPSLIGGTDIGCRPISLHDQIDRTVLQMQPLAVRKQRDLREPLHARRPGMYGIGRISALSRKDDSGRT